jgi:hypothetical protein
MDIGSSIMRKLIGLINIIYFCFTDMEADMSLVDYAGYMNRSGFGLYNEVSFPYFPL